MQPKDSPDILEEHTAVVSSDGDLGQVAMFADRRTVETSRRNKLASFKHNAARTGVEQANNLCDMMPALNHLEKQSSFKGEFHK